MSIRKPEKCVGIATVKSGEPANVIPMNRARNHQPDSNDHQGGSNKRPPMLHH